MGRGSAIVRLELQDAVPVEHSRAYATKDQLDALVAQMYQAGIPCTEAVREFKKQFIVAVLKETRGNKVQAARKIGVHRNTINRTVAALNIDVRAIREERRPPRGVRRTASVRKVAGYP